MNEANEAAKTEAKTPPATPRDVLAAISRILDAQQLARIQEAEQARTAERERVYAVIRRNNAELRQLKDQAGPRAADFATPRERLILGRLSTKMHFALTRALSALNGARDSEAQKSLAAYDLAFSAAHWVWGLLADRIKNNVDNHELTDYFVLPGEISTVVEETDAQGKPTRLSRYGEMP